MRTVITSIAFLVVASHCIANDAVTLQLKWRHQFQFAGYYAAQMQGYFQQENLEVNFKEVILGETAVEAITSGQAEFGIADSSLVLSRLRGEPVVVLAAIFQHSPLVLLTLKSSGIVHPLELHGKKIMFRRNIDDAVLQAMFVEVGLQPDDYTHIPQNFDVKALLGDADAISAYTTNQPFYFQENNIPYNTISPANYGIDFYGDMLFTSEDYLLKNPERVEAFRRAALKGWHYAVEHPEAVVDWMLANLPVQKSRDHLLFEAERTIRLIKPNLIEIGYFNPSRFLRIAEIYKQLDLAPISADLTGISYLEHLFKPPLDPFWSRLALAVVAAILLAFFLMSWVNRRLRKTIAIRTREINKANAELEKRHLLLDQHVLVCTFDMERSITDVSQAFCKLSGFSKEELIGRPTFSLIHPDFPTAELKEIRAAMVALQQWSGEIQFCNHAGDSIWLYAILEFQQAPGARSTAIFHDITDKKKILELSITDSLTGLANRRKVEEHLDFFIKQASRFGREVSLILLDIDHFKRINDTYGHNCGDETLVALSGLLQQSIREADIAGRWGGEEFVVICPETNLEGAMTLAEVLREKIAGAELIAEQSVTSSFGVAQWQPGHTAKSLFNKADAALYEAKGQGRNRVVTLNSTATHDQAGQSNPSAIKCIEA
ncbi:ABC transporter substrate-binding protein [Pseudomaricurvus alcaniphilus]|nr:ABC transporter substrate-binding protein [Pseudomaricurvus alcaniphilus]